MDEHKQQKEKDKPVISPLAEDETYGERVYSRVVNVGINFVFNLTASGLFTYWVTHSHKPFRLFGKEFEAPSVMQQRIAKKIHDMPIMNSQGPKTAYDIHKPPTTKRAKAATNAANVFTLVIPGHPILILSSWIGGKIKPWFVETLNRKHYGDAAMDDPSLKARHEMIEAQDRPTLFGGIVGRLGTIVATQATVYSIGNPSNLFTWMGNKLNISPLKKFHGMDGIAEAVGNRAGHAFEDLAPKQAAALDARMAKSGYGWAQKQIQENPALKKMPYKHASQHIGKYLAQDVLYTAVTASTIGPAIHYLKRFIPGMTDKPYIPPRKRVSAAIREARNDNERAENDNPFVERPAHDHHSSQGSTKHHPATHDEPLHDEDTRSTASVSDASTQTPRPHVNHVTREDHAVARSHHLHETQAELANAR